MYWMKEEKTGNNKDMIKQDDEKQNGIAQRLCIHQLCVNKKCNITNIKKCSKNKHTFILLLRINFTLERLHNLISCV